MKMIPIFSLKTADALVDRGFTLIRTGINYKYPQYKVFYFEDGPEVRQALEEICGWKNFIS